MGKKRGMSSQTQGKKLEMAISPMKIFCGRTSEQPWTILEAKISLRKKPCFCVDNATTHSKRADQCFICSKAAQKKHKGWGRTGALRVTWWVGLDYGKVVNGAGQRKGSEATVQHG